MSGFLPWSAMTKAEKSDAIRAGVAAFKSAREMGELHGCSRHAIIGHAARYGVKLMPARKATSDKRTLRSERHYRTKPRPRRAPQPRVQAPPRVPAVRHQPEPLAVPVMFLARREGTERREGQCVWPVSGEPGPNMLVCGCRIERGAYCGTHWAKSRTPAGRHLLTLERGSEA